MENFEVHGYITIPVKMMVSANSQDHALDMVNGLVNGMNIKNITKDGLLGLNVTTNARDYELMMPDIATVEWQHALSEADGI